ncbi:hypothetical protein M107_1583 [Bacteroides fragilis str. 3725 D9(v)]|nr:hypothetical protein M107_1583 [Bacteroides fragilis str. 3725 D9(v)]
MRERAVDTAFEYFEIPYNGCQQDNRGLYKEITLLFNIG